MTPEQMAADADEYVKQGECLVLAAGLVRPVLARLAAFLNAKYNINRKEFVDLVIRQVKEMYGDT